MGATACLNLAAQTSTGCAAYALVVPQDATAVERYAADELQAYVKRITGVSLGLTCACSPLPRRAILFRHVADVVPDGFRLTVEGERLVVASAPQAGAGALYGVYELLERFGGCAWYTPEFAVVPKRIRFDVPADFALSQVPSFALREVVAGGFRRDAAFAARNRVRFSGDDPIFGERRFRYSPRLGSCHTFAALLPPREFAAEHPDYFAEINGRRTSAPHAQPCLANPDVLKIVTARVLADIARQYPRGIRRFGLSQNDNLKYCRCAACRALDAAEGTPMASVLRFVNAVAAEVEKHYPDVVIETLAYTYTRTPPRTILPRKNVMVCYCTIEADFAKSLDESAYPINRQMLGDLEGWCATAQNVSLWDYTTDYNAYSLVRPCVRSLAPNLRRYYAFGIRELFMLGSGCPLEDFGALKAWLLSKLLWNVAADEEELLARFFRDYYGPAEGVMRRYFEAVHAAVRDEAKTPLTCVVWFGKTGISEAFLAQADAWMAEAARLAAGTPYARHVAEQRFCVDFTRVMRYLLAPDGHAAYLLMPAAKRDEARCAAMRAAAKRLVALLADPAYRDVCLADRGDAYFRGLITAFAKSGAHLA